MVDKLSPEDEKIVKEFENSMGVYKDFPKPGISFKDVAPSFLQPALCDQVVDVMLRQFKDQEIDAVTGLETRGLMLGMVMAIKLNKPFILIRKKGKLPGKCIGQTYKKEYGEDEIEMQEDAVKKGQRVLVHDDLLATGGTAEAAAKLIQKAGGEVAGFAFLCKLKGQPGEEILSKYTKNILSLITLD